VFLPFAVFIHVSITLNTVLLNEELNSLMEGGCDRGWLFPQQHLYRVVGC